MGVFSGTRSSEGLVFLVDAGNPKSYPGSGSTWYNIGNPKSNGSNSNMVYNSANGGYFDFNNSTSVSTFPNYSELNPTQGLTIESWVNFNGNDNDFIYEKGNVNTQHSLFSHGGDLNDIRFRSYHEGGGGQDLFFNKTTEGFTTNTWWHIVATYDRSYKRIYLNATERVNVAENRALITRTTGASVGRFGGTTTGYYFGGKISYVAVYERALSADEIKSHFNSIRGRYGV